MKTLVLVFFLFPSLSFAQSFQCRDIFAFAPEQSLSHNLAEVIARGRDSVRTQKISSEDKLYFQKVLALKQVDFQGFSTRELLDFHKLFASWNMLPPRQWQAALFTVLGSRLNTWTNSDFLAFALLQKVTPAELPRRFATLHKAETLKRFEKFEVTTQLEVLGAALFKQTRFTIAELRNLLTITTTTLANTTHTLRLKPLKELFRGLLLLRATETTVFFVEVIKLERELEKQMQLQGLSLNYDGTSGAQNQPVRTSYRRLMFEARLDSLFRDEVKLTEYSNAALLGFFDPVDIFYPGRKLVVEWDGSHHYFQNVILLRDGTGLRFEGESLRPMDAVRDFILRKQGYDVLRISAPMNDRLDTIDILQLIEQQNPFAR